MENHKRHSTFTAEDFYAITPHDTNDLPRPVRAILVGAAGTVVAVNDRGESVTITAQAGQLLPIQPSAVKTTSTATGLIGLV